jgi:hypothetical protein
MNRRDKVARGSGQSSEEKVSKGVPHQLTGLESVLECRAEWSLLGEKGIEALSQITGGGNAECITQPSTRSAIVGYGYHGRYLTCELADR